MSDTTSSPSNAKNWSHSRIAGSLGLIASIVGFLWLFNNNRLSEVAYFLPLAGLMLMSAYLLLSKALPINPSMKLWIEFGAIALELMLIMNALYTFDQSGFGAEFHLPFVEPEKDFWDWLQVLGVLAVPVAVTIIGASLQRTDRERAEERAKQERELAENRAGQERDLAQKRAEQERQLADERAAQEKERAEEHLRDQRLQHYLDWMTNLLLQKFGSEDEEEKEKKPEVSLVARAQTLTTLRRLDGGRKAELIRFLYEAELIGNKNQPADISLDEADLSGALLDRAELDGVNFKGANLINASLVKASLQDAHLEGVNLGGANLRGAEMLNINLANARLEGANLTKGWLEKANLSTARMEGAILTDADLTAAQLSGANLRNANLQGANLRRADLDATDLRGANVLGAKNISDISVAILDEHTIMPDGSRYAPPPPILNFDEEETQEAKITDTTIASL
jgi:hypothetical protein